MDSLDHVCNSFRSCHGFAVQLVDCFHCLVLGWMVLQRVVLVLNVFVSYFNVVITFLGVRYEDDPL